VKNRIAILRKERGLTLTALATAAGTTKAQIQKLERGERRLSLEWMEKLARAMNVKISDLLPGNEITCQHTAAETEILEIVQRLPEDDRFLLVRIAKELLGAPRQTAEAPRPARRTAGRKA
jgi:transcriptional regulator with XRE-family HTH domain